MQEGAPEIQGRTTCLESASGTIYNIVSPVALVLTTWTTFGMVELDASPYKAEFPAGLLPCAISHTAPPSLKWDASWDTGVLPWIIKYASSSSSGTAVDVLIGLEHVASWTNAR